LVFIVIIRLVVIIGITLVILVWAFSTVGFSSFVTLIIASIVLTILYLLVGSILKVLFLSIFLLEKFNLNLVLNSVRGVSIQFDGLEKTGLIKRKFFVRAIQALPSLLVNSNKNISISFMVCFIHAGDEFEISDFLIQKYLFLYYKQKNLKMYLLLRSVEMAGSEPASVNTTITPPTDLVYFSY